MTTRATEVTIAAPWWHVARERWLRLRDKLLANPHFQRRAAAFAPTRPIARRHARELFDLVAGFVYSQVLVACVELRLFDLLAEGPQTLDRLAPRLGLAPDAALRLLAAAVSLRLVDERRGGRYGLGALGAPMVGNAAIAAMVAHHTALYADLADPVALLRAPPGAGGPRMVRYWAYGEAAGAAPVGTASPAVGGREATAASETGLAAVDAEVAASEAAGRAGANADAAERIAAYSALMAASQPLVADEILDAYPLARHRCLLDVGGGDGSFLLSAAARAPALRVLLFDLPPVAARAAGRFVAAGLGTRAVAVGGSFLADALPTGADVATLIRVVHDHGDAVAMGLLRAVRRALPPGGVLLLAEPMAGTRGAEPMGDAYFGFYLLAMGQGRPRTAAALTQMLEAAGFERVRSVRTRMPLQTQLLVAQVPAAYPPLSAA
jgi:demethylspheroidene O-methyltransferase